MDLNSIGLKPLPFKTAYYVKVVLKDAIFKTVIIKEILNF